MGGGFGPFARSPGLGRAPLGPGFPLFPAARDALARYGGISVRQSGAGEECARETFELIPLLALGEEEFFREVGSRVGTRLYPLGEAGGGHLFLAISTEGRVFAFMDDDIWLLGESMEEGLEALVSGCKSTRVRG